MIGSLAMGRRYLVPEVVQTSAMDCGPAVLKSLLEGFEISVSYEWLREACQTNVDGTSIDTVEEAAVQLGLEAEQIVVPVDHVLLGEAQALPAIAVVCLPNGSTHFVLVWGRYGRRVQVMDPATGRRWPSYEQFLDELYVHRLQVSAVDWRAWAGTAEFLNPLRRRLALLSIDASTISRLIDAALADASWRSLAVLDAATRMIAAMVHAGGLKRGTQAARSIALFYDRACAEGLGEVSIIPSAYWSVEAAPTSLGEDEQLYVRGAVLVRVRGRRQADRSTLSADSLDQPDIPEPLSPELTVALEETPVRPIRELLGLLGKERLLAPASLAVALCLVAAGMLVEAMLFRGFLDLGRMLGLVGQRVGAISALIVFVTALLLLELQITSGTLRLGRRLEAHLRILFLEKIRRVGDRYFQSRLTSDMAERAHNVHHLRLLPDLGRQFIRSICELILIVLGIIWLDPASTYIVLLAAMAVIGLPLLFQPLLNERDLQIRSHVGALSRFYFDALLGLITVRAHAAERAIRYEHEHLLAQWKRARYGHQQAIVALDAAQSFVGLGLTIWLVLAYLMRGSGSGDTLLLVYWALSLPVLGQDIALTFQLYSGYRNLTVRLLEPLRAVEEHHEAQGEQASFPETADGLATREPGVAISLVDVTVRAAGHTVLEGIELDIPAGSHVAIVGSSGAGKSSLIGILLGWHRPVAGQVLVDGAALDSGHLERMRQETVWVDPTVQLWNRSFIDNINYGASASQYHALGKVIDQADLRKLLEKLPAGLQTPLGEGGALVSGGEGQRVRLGRGMLNTKARLVVLDEPFRGLDRPQRRDLLARTRVQWRDATLLCVTHDISETQAFERVLVIDGGRIVEDGDPAALAARPDSRYRALLDAEDAVRKGLWLGTFWRRVRLEAGHLIHPKSSEQA